MADNGLVAAFTRPALDSPGDSGSTAILNQNYTKSLSALNTADEAKKQPEWANRTWCAWQFRR